MEQGTLGKRIAYHRKRLGMTQEQLAQRVGVSAQAVSKWENNLSCPDITILPELASIFGISVDELLGRTPPKEERVHEAEVIKPEEKEHILDYTIGSAARSGLWFAIYVLAIGALFLVNALGKFDVSVWTILWTSALLLGGLSMLTHRFSCFSIGLMLVGGYSLLTAFGFLSIGFRWSVLIPVFLLLWGVSLLVDYFCGRRRKQHHVRASYGGKFTQDTRCDNGHLSCELSFGSCRVPVVTPQLRSRANAVNFGIVYGQQAFGLAQSLDIPFGEAKEMIDRYFEAYPGVRAYLDATVEEAKKTGYATTMFGRKRHVPELKAANAAQRGFGERTAMNHPMQGSAADIIKLAMKQVQQRLHDEGFEARLMLQVHDELDFSVPEGEIERLGGMVREVMENVVELRVPLEVDVSWGDNWAQAH